MTRRKRTSEECWKDFKDRITELGGTVLEREWLGVDAPHNCLCLRAHKCRPRLSDIKRGRGMCLECSGHGPVTAWTRFQEFITSNGGILIEEGWRGSNFPHDCICGNGHRIKVIPSYGRFCRKCAGNDPETAEENFRSVIKAFGGMVIESTWLGSTVPHRCICPSGHECNPRPNGIAQGKGMCLACAGRDSNTAFQEFKHAVTAAGGTVIDTTWKGAKKPHACICALGHKCYPAPDMVRRGQGMCRTCAHRTWDVFYVVTSGHGVKFGITSGDSGPRLASHARVGYTTVLRLIESLPDAHDLERHVIETLRERGNVATMGREWFHLNALPIILGVVDTWTKKISQSTSGS